MEQMLEMEQLTTPIPVQLVGRKFPIRMKLQTALHLRELLEDLILVTEELTRRSETLSQVCLDSLKSNTSNTRKTSMNG